MMSLNNNDVDESAVHKPKLKPGALDDLPEHRSTLPGDDEMDPGIPS